MDGPPGILPCQTLQTLAEAGAIGAVTPLAAGQVQPASLDLRLAARCWRVRASFLPGPQRSVAERIQRVAMHELDLEGGEVLERGCVYIAELQERLRLPPGIAGRANPKSSTGRLDIFVRLLTDGGGTFDDVAEGYDGPLYLEIAPQTFSVLARSGTRLSQLRLKRGQPASTASTTVGVDLTGPLAGYRARRHAGVVDLDAESALDPADFFEPLESRRGELLLDPGEFYILASKEVVDIPLAEAAEMTPIDPAVGEFRAHYAGFFDPGFASRAVLEVRSREAPFLLEDGQMVARLVFEPMSEPPSHAYGEGGSHYQRQGLKLSKHFRDWVSPSV